MNDLREELKRKQDYLAELEHKGYRRLAASCRKDIDRIKEQLKQSDPLNHRQLVKTEGE